MRLSKIEKQPFIFGRYDVVTPVMRFRCMPNISSKNGERVAMIAIAGDHLPTCVAAGENDCQHKRCHSPKVGSVRCADRTPQRGVPTINLRGQKQTERWNHREDSIDAL